MKSTVLINIESLCVSCIIGVHKKERLRAQPIELDICLEVKAGKLSNAKNCHATVDWEVLVKQVKLLLVERKFYLAEEAALAVAKMIIKFPRAKCVSVTLKKFEAISGVRSVQAQVKLSR